MYPRPGVVSLPLEIFCMVKENIPEMDFRTNVCFYRAHPWFARCYGNEEKQNAYFAKLCITHGIGVKHGEDPERNPDIWRTIAFECIEQDGWCEHPQCGVKRLKQNKKELFNMEFEVDGYTAAALKAAARNANKDPWHVLPSTLLSFIAFQRSRYVPGTAKLLPPGYLGGALLDYQDGDIMHEEDMNRRLVRHPVAYRSFAFFPAVSSARVFHSICPSVFRPPISRNVYGVTIGDVIKDLSTTLDFRIDLCHDRAKLIEELEPMDVNHILRSAKSLNMTNRDFLYYFRYDGLTGQDRGYYNAYPRGGNVGPDFFPLWRLARCFVSSPAGLALAPAERLNLSTQALYNVVADPDD